MKRLSFGLVFTFFILLSSLTALGQTTIVNYDFASTTAGTPCGFGGPLTTASGVTSSFITSTGSCTTPAGTSSTVPPAFVSNSNNQSVSISGFALGASQFFQFQISGVSNYSNYMVFFQSQRSPTGPTTATLQYSTNGTTFTDFSSVTVNETFTASSFDLSAISAIENQPTVYFRIRGFEGSSSAGTFRIDNFQVQAMGPTSAPASIGGRVTNDSGRGLNFVLVTVTGGNLKEPLTVLTDNFGNYVLPGLEVGETYVIQVSSKRYTFVEHSRVYNLLDNITDANFIGSGW